MIRRRIAFLLCSLLAVVLGTGCQSKDQADKEARKAAVTAVEKTLQDESGARIQYARRFQEFLPNVEGATINVTTRSTKNKDVENLNDILLVQVSGASVPMQVLGKDLLPLADATRLKDLKFSFFLVGSFENVSYRAYDVDKGTWLPTDVSFCRPADECTIRAGKFGGLN